MPALQANWVDTESPTTVLTRAKNIINGYFREYCEYIIPLLINHLCLKYYHISYVLNDEIDIVKDKLVYISKDVKVWRWDPDQLKWRGRGIGQLTIHHNADKNFVKLVFIDLNHLKVRLLQYIIGKINAKNYTKQDAFKLWPSSDFVDNCVIWDEKDYTMDRSDPLNGKWRVKFQDTNTKDKQQFLKMLTENAFRI